MLAVQAMFRLGENDVDGAWSDLLAGHRLARLVSERASTMNTFLVAVALDGTATNGEMALIAHGLTPEQARKCMTEHAELPPIDSLAHVLELGQRLQSLDTALHQLSEFGLDVNTMLRKTNRLYDRLVSAQKITRFAERKAALAEIDNDFKQRIAAARRPLTRLASVLTSARRAESIGDVLFQMLMPAIVQADSA